MRMSLSLRVDRSVLALLSVLAGTLFTLALPSSALAAESCPNEPYRAASDSTQLPGCRAYELVSPSDAGGTVGTYSLDSASTTFLQVGLGGSLYVASDSNLDQQLRGELDVQGNGEDVFWNSTATPPGTGAIEDAGAWDAFHSARTSAGWNTQDLLPSGQQIPGNPGGSVKVVLGASADGSSALVLAQQALYPSAFANSQQAALGEWRGFSIYRVSTDSAFAPQLVTHGELPLPENKTLESLGTTGPFELLSASPDLSVVTFRSTIPLESNDNCTDSSSASTVYSWNASSIDGLAHVIFRFGSLPCVAPNVAGVPTVLPDGRPILMPNSANFGGILGPVVENSPERLQENALTQLTGSSGGALLSVTPDGATAYVQASEALDSHFPGATGDNIYAVSTTLGEAPKEDGTTPGVTCISCIGDQINVSYVATSRDGTHVLFTTAGAEPGLWEWDASSGAHLLTSATGFTPEDVIVSENGQYVIVLTPEALSAAKDTNNGPDLYELSAGRPPTLITSGTSADSYTLVQGRPIAGVSDDGQRVVYNAQPSESVGGRALSLPNVIDEWDAGKTTQLSPAKSPYEYIVQAVAGDELQDVFFIANEALVPWDFNAGQADVYDARAAGGFPFCTPGNPGPPRGLERCGAATSNANPTVPPALGYVANLTPPDFQLAGLSADTSQLVAGTSQTKALTRSQKLVKALKACVTKPKKQRTACERRARDNYAPTKKKGKDKR